MAVGLCPSGRESKLVRVSLVSATARGTDIGLGDVTRICSTISDWFGFKMEWQIETGASILNKHELEKRSRVLHDDVLMAEHPNHTSGGRVVPRPRMPGADGLDWAFIHRHDEKPYTETLPNKKSISVFLRNATDPCIPCTFLCRGCGEGSVRATISCLTPYGIDSELTADSAVECIGAALGNRLEVEYAKKGLMWNGYIPAAVRRFSGTMLNLALLDYLHRFSGILADFEFPMTRR